MNEPITPRKLAQKLRKPLSATMKVLSRMGAKLRSADDPIDEDTFQKLVEDPAARKPAPAASNRKVFIVHGHDKIRYQVASFINSLGLQAIMLDEQASGGKTVIEKLEKHGAAAFAVVLFTPDDEGRPRKRGRRKEAALEPRARQNVVLEFGYFTARLDRQRVCALAVPGVELPSDLGGLLSVKLDAGGGWKYELENELVAAGVLRRE